MTENDRQVTTYSKRFLGGYYHLILGRTTILPVIHTTAGLQSGLFREARFRNGKRPGPLVPPYGFTANVR